MNHDTDWQSIETGKKIPFKPIFCPGEPDSNAQKCLALGYTGGQYCYHNLPCEWELPFLCQESDTSLFERTVEYLLSTNADLAFFRDKFKNFKNCLKV